ncbi:N-acetyltransferase family protein [Paenibacillus sp. Z6-24]
MITFVKTSSELLEVELSIINSNPFYNRIIKGREQLTAEEIRQEVTETVELGAERYVICRNDQPIGIVEYLSLNPNEGYPWLGLFMIGRQYQGQRWGQQAFQAFEQRLIGQGVEAFRLAVNLENELAHAFWKRQNFQYIKHSITRDNMEVIIYEKELN